MDLFPFAPLLYNAQSIAIMAIAQHQPGLHPGSTKRWQMTGMKAIRWQMEDPHQIASVFRSPDYLGPVFVYTNFYL